MMSLLELGWMPRLSIVAIVLLLPGVAEIYRRWITSQES
jgi:hypothetical protein